MAHDYQHFNRLVPKHSAFLYDMLTKIVQLTSG